MNKAGKSNKKAKGGEIDDHDCEGIMCFDKSHFDDGGKVAIPDTEDTSSATPVDTTAKPMNQMNINGPKSLGQAWNRIKHSMDPTTAMKPIPAGYANGGRVDEGLSDDEKRAARENRHPVSVSGGSGREESRHGNPKLNQEGTSRSWSSGMSHGHRFDVAGTYGSESNTLNRKKEAKENLEALKSQKPKLKGMADGGSVRSKEKGVHLSDIGVKKGPSYVGQMVRNGEDMRGIHEEHQEALKESRAINPNLKGLAEGGEVMDDMGEDDDMLMESCGHECMEALKKDDVKGFIDAIKALIMSCK